MNPQLVVAITSAGETMRCRNPISGVRAMIHGLPRVLPIHDPNGDELLGTGRRVQALDAFDQQT
jgi:hypothetical protein